VIIHGWMAELARRRPVFHSEADFQFSLAWLIKELHKDKEVRLEYPIFRNPETGKNSECIDIWIARPDNIFIELKYRTNLLTTECFDERYTLRAHNAPDVGRYSFIKDIGRLERFVASRSNSKGFAVLLTNDDDFWKPPRNRSKIPNDRYFRVHEGAAIEGNLTWVRPLSEEMRTQFPSISLVRPYCAIWNDYSSLSQDPHGMFRYLAIEVL